MKETRKLYDIGIDIIEESFTEEGEIDVDKLDGLQLEFNDKAGRCIAFMKHRKFQEDLCDAEIKRLKGEIKSIEADKKKFGNDRVGIGEYLKGWAEKIGLKKIESGIHRATVAKKPMSVEVLDESQISHEFQRTITKVSVDKVAVKKHFQETGEIPIGINIHHGETHLLVRYGKEESNEQYV